MTVVNIIVRGRTNLKPRQQKKIEKFEQIKKRATRPKLQININTQYLENIVDLFPQALKNYINAKSLKRLQ
ncbi:unnamed protein product [Paramecium octaurelia]|uniref:Uncharacterized protein n=1 Tax=Paramecium octaurelia TaxID=43137 RepID=A0A8S1XJF9_PAROT|nr:unnamed protein product [Paramecium octaurelia]